MLQDSKLRAQAPQPGRRIGVNPSNRTPAPTASLEATFKRQEVQLLQYQFENKVLAQRLDKLHGQTEAPKDPNAKRTFTNFKDVSLNYNTKTHYVSVLEKKVEELTDAMHLQKKEDQFTKIKEIEMEIASERKNYQSLKAKYSALKERFLNLNKHKAMFDKTLTAARKMRGILKVYADSGFLNKAAVNSLDFEAFDRVLDGGANPYTNDEEEPELVFEEIENAQGIPSGAGEGQIRELLAKRDKVIRNLQERLKEVSRNLQSANADLGKFARAENAGLQSKINEARDGFKKMLKEVTDKNLKEIAAFNAKILALETEKSQFSKKIREITLNFEEKIQELKAEVLKNELRAQEALDSNEILKEKLKKQDERIRKMLKDNQLQASKMMNSTIKASAISREAIARSLLAQTLPKNLEGSSRKAVVEIDLAELKKIAEDLNKYDALGGNFEALKEVNSSLAARNQEVELELEKTAEKFEKLSAELSAAKSKLALAENEMRALAEKIAGAERRLSENEKIQEELNSQILASKSVSANLQSEIASLKQAAFDKEAELLAGAKALEDKNADFAKLCQEAARQQDECQRLAEELRGLKLEREQGGDLVSELSLKNEALEFRVSELENFEAQFQRAEAENSKLVSEALAKEVALKEALGQLAAAQRERGDFEKLLRVKNEKFKSRLKEEGPEGQGGKSSEQLAIMAGVLEVKDQEIATLKEIIAADEKEKQGLSQRLSELQLRFGASIEDQQIYAQKINELTRLQKTLEGQKTVPGDAVALNLKCAELEDENRRLAELAEVLGRESASGKSQIALSAKTIENLKVEILGLEEALNSKESRLISLESASESSKEKIADLSRTVEQIEKALAARENERDELRRAFEEFKNFAADRLPGLNPNEEPADLKMLKSERERLSAGLAGLQRENAELKASLKDRALLLKMREDEISSLKGTATAVIDYGPILKEREEQIAEMVLFSNKKSEAIESLTNQLTDLESKLKLAKEQSAALAEQIRSNPGPPALLQDQKLAPGKPAQDFEHEARPLDPETKFDSERNALVQRMSAELEKSLGQLNSANDQVRNLRAQAAGLKEELARVSGERQEALRREGERQREIAGLMERIGELSAARAHYERHFQDFKIEMKGLEAAVASRDKDVQIARAKRAKAKIKNNMLVLEKKLLADDVNSLNAKLKDKDQEISRVKLELAELQESFSNAASEFIEKLEEERDRGAKLDSGSREKKGDSSENFLSKIKELELENKKLTGKLNTLNETISLLRRTSTKGEGVNFETSKIVGFEQKIADLKSKNANLLSNQEKMQAYSNEMNDKLNAADAKNDFLAKRLKEKEASLAELGRQLAVKAREVEEYERAILDRGAGPENREGGISAEELLDARKRLAECEGRVADYKFKFEELQKRLSPDLNYPERDFPSSLNESQNSLSDKISARDKNDSPFSDKNQLDSQTEEFRPPLNQQIAEEDPLLALSAREDGVDEKLGQQLAICRQLQKELVSKENLQAELQNQISKLNRQISQSKAENAKINAANSKKKEKIKGLRTKLREQAEIFANFALVKQEMSQTADQLAENQILTAQLQKRCQDLEDLINAWNFSSNKLQALLAKKDTEMNRLLEENDKIDFLKRDLQKKTEEISETLSLIQQKEQKIQKLKNKGSGLKATLKNLKFHLCQIQEELARAREDIILKEQENSSQLERSRRYRQIIKGLEQQNQVQGVQVRNQLGEMKKNVEVTLGISQKMENRASQMREEQERVSQDFNSRLEAAMQEAVVARDLLERAKAENDQLKSQYQAIPEKNNELPSKGSFFKKG